VAKLDTKHIFTGNIDLVFESIRKYGLYPEYLPGVTGIEVLPAQAEGSTCQVRYELNLIKKIYYVLDMYEESPNKIWWQLADSNIMKQNNGSWLLDSKGSSQTKATYSLDIKFKGLVPGAITDQIAKANLPGMLIGFQKIIDQSL
jgi:ribosome-associated toxin RatA of RatAB toxin-antitoxin module